MALMMMPDVSTLINEYYKNGDVHFKKHALVRIIERNISIEDVDDALLNSTVIESYSEDKPLPSYLVIGYTKKKRPLHVLIALDAIAQHIWIITVYEPDPTKWFDQMTQRKKL